jgi:hypothetical protein
MNFSHAGIQNFSFLEKQSGICISLKSCYLSKNYLKIKIVNKQEIPRKQGAHFLGARAQIQDSWVFSSSV